VIQQINDSHYAVCHESFRGGKNKLFKKTKNGSLLCKTLSNKDNKKVHVYYIIKTGG